MKSRVFINRTINLRKIEYLGLDMDHTLIRYNSYNFEALAHNIVINKLINQKGYPKSIEKVPFDMNKTIRGLVLDKVRGNLLKVNCHAGIRQSSHGTKRIDYSEQKKLYKSTYIDIRDQRYFSVDTSFSISYALLFASLVDLKDGDLKDQLPTYEQIANDITFCLDQAHRDGSIKSEVQRNLDKYILKDKRVVEGLERFKKHGKKIFILTNSLYEYTRILLEYAIDPFLRESQSWKDLFDVVITGAQKPRFFWDQLSFMKINPDTGQMVLHEGSVKKGVYHGGDAIQFTDSIGVTGEEILYVGDHIYGDILRLKKDCNWRTALVLEELEDEISSLKKSMHVDRMIRALMEEKEPLEERITQMLSAHKETGKDLDRKEFDEVQERLAGLDKKLSDAIKKHQSFFNPFWGEIMRIGNEESYFARQVERYACVYMPNLADLLALSPRSYLRGYKSRMPHEAIL